MRIRPSHASPWAIALFAMASLLVLLLRQPRPAHASHYDQGSLTYEIGVTKVWDDEIEPEPVDITMSYSGDFQLRNGVIIGERRYPDEILIYYEGGYCGSATPKPDSEPGLFQIYTFSVDIPFHFDGESSSERVPFDYESFSFRFTVDSTTYILDEEHDTDDTDIYLTSLPYSIPADSMYFYESDPDYQGYNNLQHIRDATFSESSSSGVRYDFDVTCDYRIDRDTSSGAMTATYTAEFTITNHDPEGSLELTATKTVNGGTPDQAYTFQILDADGNVLQTKQNGSDGTIRFDPIDYGVSDIGNEYTYRVVEQAGTDEGITYDDSVYVVTVTPYQDPDDVSRIVASPTITRDGQQVSSITFDNGKATPEPADIEPTPGTGDPSGSLAWLAATLAAAAGVFLGLQRRAQG